MSVMTAKFIDSLMTAKFIDSLSEFTDTLSESLMTAKFLDSSTSLELLFSITPVANTSNQPVADPHGSGSVILEIYNDQRP